ncbi:MAG: hypothetical protein AAB541_00790 [Patescibacteria group bacterium]
MLTFFGKFLYNKSDEKTVLVFSFRRGTQALPGGAIPVGGYVVEGPCAFDESVVAQLLWELGHNSDVISPKEITARLKNLAEEYGWSWHSSNPERTYEFAPGVWLGDHFVAACIQFT